MRFVADENSRVSLSPSAYVIRSMLATPPALISVSLFRKVTVLFGGRSSALEIFQAREIVRR